MNLIYEVDNALKETKYIKSNNLEVENNKGEIKLKPLENKNAYYILTKNSSRYFLPPEFKIEFDICDNEGKINFCIGNKESNHSKSFTHISTNILDLKKGINNITIIYEKGKTIFKNGSEIKYSKNKNFGENISFWISFWGKNNSNKSITLKNIKITTTLPTISVFGTCSSRDMFNSQINPGYKNYFKIERSLIKDSIIGLMENPIKYDEKDTIVKEGSGGRRGSTKVRTKRLRDNLNKDFIEIIKKIEPEFLVLDISYDIKAGYLEIDNNKIITNNYFDMPYSNFYKNLKEIRHVTIKDNFEEFMELWKRNCDKFFKSMEENCPNTTIILNTAKDTTTVKKTDGSIEEVKRFKRIAKKDNPYRIILENYICENFNVEVLHYDYNTSSDENHLWNPYPLHYEPNYYKYATSQLNDIIKRTRLSKNNQDYIELNNEIKTLRREKIILENKIYENKELEEKLNNLLSSNSWKITKPLRYIRNILRN